MVLYFNLFIINRKEEEEKEKQNSDSDFNLSSNSKNNSSIKEYKYNLLIKEIEIVKLENQLQKAETKLIENRLKNLEIENCELKKELERLRETQQQDLLKMKNEIIETLKEKKEETETLIKEKSGEK